MDKSPLLLRPKRRKMQYINPYIFQDTTIPTNGLVAYYPFNGNANDESGNGNNGTVNGATLTTDRFGNPNSAYSFDGNDYIDCGSSVGDFSGNFSINVWIQTTDATQDMILSKYQNASNLWYLDKTNSSSFVLSTPDENIDLNGFVSVNDGNWYMITVINDGINLSIYVNNTFDTSTSIGSYNGFSTSANLYIGGRQIASTLRFNGKIDDIRIYNRDLTTEEITLLYNE